MIPVLTSIPRYKYADYAKTVLIVSPEKLYEPKALNIKLIRVEGDYDSFDLRSKLRPFLELC